MLTRLLRLEDAPALTELERANREAMASTSPIRRESFYTVEGQVTAVRASLEQHAQGVGLPHAIVAPNGRLVGRITLNEIVRGPLQSCSVGYWVNPGDAGRGVATAALREMVHVAFTELRLHRVQASTLLDNVASQMVLRRNGFERYGTAPRYLKIAGRWQDHAMFQVLNDALDE